jgi:hypothetical protein
MLRPTLFNRGISNGLGNYIIHSVVFKVGDILHQHVSSTTEYEPLQAKGSYDLRRFWTVHFGCERVGGWVC